MMTPIPIHEAVAILKVDRPALLCLDTCELLEAVRGVATGSLHHARSFRKILNKLVSSKSFRLVLTYLVRKEWDQNADNNRKVVKEFLAATRNAVDRIADARTIGGLPLVDVDTSLFESTLAERLAGSAEEVMDHALFLKRDDSCVERALGRVMDHSRPSHKNQIKDSIHWEHYLELSRQLAAAGHDQDRIFVSANKSDFWADVKNNDSSLHPDLIDEAKAVGLQFRGKLNDALRILGV